MSMMMNRNEIRMLEGDEARELSERIAEVLEGVSLDGVVVKKGMSWQDLWKGRLIRALRDSGLQVREEVYVCQMFLGDLEMRSFVELLVEECIPIKLADQDRPDCELLRALQTLLRQLKTPFGLFVKPDHRWELEVVLVERTRR